MNISIVKPQTKHTDAIAAICSRGWRQTVDGILSEEYQVKNVNSWYNSEKVLNDIHTGSYSHVALINNELVGVIGGGLTGKSVAEIFVLYVDETYRYKGIGRLLLKELTDQQMQNGATEQWISVQEGNQHGIPFYIARGFTFKEKKNTVIETDEKQVSLRYSRQLFLK